MTWGIHGHLALISGSTVVRFNVDPENYEALRPVRRASRHQIIGGSQVVQDFGLVLQDNEITFSNLKVTQAVAAALMALYQDPYPTYTLKDWAGHEFTVFFADCSIAPTIEFVWGPTRTAQGGGAATITLDADSVDVDDFYIDANIRLVSGPGAGEARHITDYVGASRVATVHLPWVVPPTGSTGYQMADVIHEVSVRFWVLDTVKLFAEAV
jgi:hypothetical protein